MTMKKAVHSRASAFHRRGSGCTGCVWDTMFSLSICAARTGGLDNTSQPGPRFGPDPEVRQRSAPSRRSSSARSTALPVSAIARS
jgi:hypothetical protein